MKNCVFGIMFCAACSMIGETCAERQTVSLVKRGSPSPVATSSFNQDLKANIQAVLTIEGMEPAKIVFFNNDGSYSNEHERTATYTVKTLDGTDRNLTVKLSGSLGLERLKDESGAGIVDTDIINAGFDWNFKGNTNKGELNTEVTFNNVNKNDEIRIIFGISDKERDKMKGGEYAGKAKFEILSVS